MSRGQYLMDLATKKTGESINKDFDQPKPSNQGLFESPDKDGVPLQSEEHPTSDTGDLLTGNTVVMNIDLISNNDDPEFLEALQHGQIIIYQDHLPAEMSQAEKIKMLLIEGKNENPAENFDNDVKCQVLSTNGLLDSNPCDNVEQIMSNAVQHGSSLSENEQILNVSNQSITSTEIINNALTDKSLLSELDFDMMEVLSTNGLLDSNPSDNDEEIMSNAVQHGSSISENEQLLIVSNQSITSTEIINNALADKSLLSELDFDRMESNDDVLLQVADETVSLLVESTTAMQEKLCEKVTQPLDSD
ncbi:hypothetical protein LSTR_LSTR008080 [Laodelphax striatellus]|uniref:Uncharacterized protein n=1 Tax=Laodelphax striatellus TaxID=195883 RepID=A0A482XD01_LAOST|nr:hypothetical protein LSTR_LSTR008080 [Laodelphax striatellus]